jgi:5-methylcytosine-specific restriction endonuclease McrA
MAMHQPRGSLGRQPRSGSSRPELNKGRWQAIRKQVRLRDGNRCRSCGTDGTDRGNGKARLSVHHIDPGGPDTYENLVTLCSPCHAQADAAARRQRKARPDLPPPASAWSRHWYGPYDERCPRCREHGKPCADAAT